MDLQSDKILRLNSRFGGLQPDTIMGIKICLDDLQSDTVVGPKSRLNYVREACTLTEHPIIYFDSILNISLLILTAYSCLIFHFGSTLNVSIFILIAHWLCGFKRREKISSAIIPLIYIDYLPSDLLSDTPPLRPSPLLPIIDFQSDPSWYVLTWIFFFFR